MASSSGKEQILCWYVSKLYRWTKIFLRVQFELPLVMITVSSYHFNFLFSRASNNSIQWRNTKNQIWFVKQKHHPSRGRSGMASQQSILFRTALTSWDLASDFEAPVQANNENPLLQNEFSQIYHGARIFIFLQEYLEDDAKGDKLPLHFRPGRDQYECRPRR